MIISGHPEQGLQKHQHQAYSAVTKAFETDNSAAVVIPTGCGKSFIALQLMQDNKDKNILFLAPTNVIKDQIYGYIAKYIVGEETTSKRPAQKIAKEELKKQEKQNEMAKRLLNFELFSNELTDEEIF